MGSVNEWGWMEQKWRLRIELSRKYSESILSLFIHGYPLKVFLRSIFAKVKNDHRSKFSNLSNWKKEAWKNQGFNGIRTRDLRITGTLLYQLSYEATHWEWGQYLRCLDYNF